MPGAPQVTTTFTSLTPDQEQRYAMIRQKIAEIVGTDPDGLMFALNALVLADPHALLMMSVWSDQAMGGKLDERSLAGVIYERPLSLPQLSL